MWWHRHRYNGILLFWHVLCVHQLGNTQWVIVHCVLLGKVLRHTVCAGGFHSREGFGRFSLLKWLCSVMIFSIIKESSTVWPGIHVIQSSTINTTFVKCIYCDLYCAWRLIQLIVMCVSVGAVLDCIIFQRQKDRWLLRSLIPWNSPLVFNWTCITLHCKEMSK